MTTADFMHLHGSNAQDIVQKNVFHPSAQIYFYKIHLHLKKAHSTTALLNCSANSERAEYMIIIKIGFASLQSRTARLCFPMQLCPGQGSTIRIVISACPIRPVFTICHYNFNKNLLLWPFLLLSHAGLSIVDQAFQSLLYKCVFLMLARVFFLLRMGSVWEENIVAAYWWEDAHYLPNEFKQV